MGASRYLKYIIPPAVFGTHRTKAILSTNPTVDVKRSDAVKTVVTVYDYDAGGVEELEAASVEQCFHYKDNGR